MDLALVLVLLTAASGLIWLFDSLYLAPRRLKLSQLSSLEESADLPPPPVPMWVDLARSLFPVFLIVLLLRSFLVEPFRIPSASMMPTLLIGDFILVNKYTYGIRLPVLNSKVFEIGQPERGDVVVFRYPEDPSVPFIKRIVGLPGDRIAYDNLNKVLYVNDQPMSQDTVGIFQGVGSGSNMTGAEERTEHLQDRNHAILVVPDRLAQAPHLQMVVPAGHYFVLGDNRDNSRDSRYWGTVPEENLIGKAFFIWMNFDWQNGGVGWHRLGSRIL